MHGDQSPEPMKTQVYRLTAVLPNLPDLACVRRIFLSWSDLTISGHLLYFTCDQHSLSAVQYTAYTEALAD